MPVLPSGPIDNAVNLLARSTAPPVNVTAPVLEVVCAWPVSGQYGPGTRYLYYVLIAACVFARKEEWIRNACLAAVLLFPAVAALHAIILAALHVEGAVDMDVYGAFQLCTIGILTAPATVRLSKTYFNNPGRNIIFIWTVLILAGLLSLTVEFIRLQPYKCPSDDAATIAWEQNKAFPYGSTCGLTCAPDIGPQSPMRQGAANNIYVIPSPHELDFNTATLLAAACCIPAILSLVSTWIKIMDDNWENLKLSGSKSKKKPDNETIDGTNGATPLQMKGIAERIRGWLTLIEIPVFIAAVLAIVVKGEMNFWSAPVDYQTEPMASVGQWAPIVGTGIAILGSLYLIIAAEMDAASEEKTHIPGPTTQTCAECGGNTICERTDSSTDSARMSGDSVAVSSSEIERTTLSTIRQAMTTQPGSDPGGRKKVARVLSAASTYLAAKAHTNLEDTGFERDERTNFPEIPAEMYRNKKLPEIRNVYNTPIPRSRATSFVGSDTSNGEGSSRMPRRQLSLPVRPPLTASVGRHYSNTLPTDGRPFDGPTFLEIRSLYGNLPERQWSPTEGLTPSEEDPHGRPLSTSDVNAELLSASGPTTPKIVLSSD